MAPDEREGPRRGAAHPRAGQPARGVARDQPQAGALLISAASSASSARETGRTVDRDIGARDELGRRFGRAHRDPHRVLQTGRRRRAGRAHRRR